MYGSDMNSHKKYQLAIMTEEEVAHRARMNNYDEAYMSVLSQLNSVPYEYIKQIVNKHRALERRQEEEQMGRREISQDVRNEVIAAKKQGKTLHQISKDWGIAVSTASKIWREYNNPKDVKSPSKKAVVATAIKSAKATLKRIDTVEDTADEALHSQLLAEIERKSQKLRDDLADLESCKHALINAFNLTEEPF